MSNSEQAVGFEDALQTSERLPLFQSADLEPKHFEATSLSASLVDSEVDRMTSSQVADTLDEMKQSQTKLKQKTKEAITKAEAETDKVKGELVVAQSEL